MAGMTNSSSNPFNPELWRPVDAPGVNNFTDITYHRHVGEGRANGIVRIAFDLSLIHISEPTRPY